MCAYPSRSNRLARAGSSSCVVLCHISSPKPNIPAASMRRWAVKWERTRGWRRDALTFVFRISTALASLTIATSHTRHTGRYMFAFLVTCGDCSTVLLDIQPSCHATLATQQPTAYPRRTCCLNTSVRILARCSQLPGKSIERTPLGDRLFRGISRSMLSLARIPQPQIASFRFHDDGTVTLTNRPLTCSMMILENDGTPRTMERNSIYLSTEPFIADLFSFHDKRFISHPNAVYNHKDCHSEMAAKVLLRALAYRYVRQDLRNGPFFLQLGDFHASNIFVDDDWNMTSLIDLEWVSALPVEKMTVPYWLTGCSIDTIRREKLVEFNTIREEFMNIFEEEEGQIAAEHDYSLTQIMRESWESGGVWFWHSAMSTNAIYPLFTDHICPRFSSRLLFREEELLSKFGPKMLARSSRARWANIISTRRISSAYLTRNVTLAIHNKED
ncbi:Uncharacterized protein TCAP_02379 [Tolypocladium capitatum]|uniref:Aminoglycoside phosphotransferase domain-containing protein n=1 Tax=Tolypocladium capitatum TaxID=45235 RepID=A0A2K3QJH8_9HYPO|nr:Uncharacterized protein TCAP_02379 [Tolypocladium capitatum]